MVEIFPSLVSSDILNLEKQIKELEPYCSGFHLDVMDFHFVPNLTWGPEFVNKIRKVTKTQLQIHLMVEYPENYLELLNLNAYDIISIHLESKSKLSIVELLNKIKEKNLIPSIAINPETDIREIFNLKGIFQNVLLMGVNPGFSGQKFIPKTLDRLIALNEFKKNENLNFQICVDGGITFQNYRELTQNGATQLAIASAIFNSENPIETLKKFNS